MINFIELFQTAVNSGLNPDGTSISKYTGFCVTHLLNLLSQFHSLSEEDKLKQCLSIDLPSTILSGQKYYIVGNGNIQLFVKSSYIDNYSNDTNVCTSIEDVFGQSILHDTSDISVNMKDKKEKDNTKRLSRIKEKKKKVSKLVTETIRSGAYISSMSVYDPENVFIVCNASDLQQLKSSTLPHTGVTIVLRDNAQILLHMSQLLSRKCCMFELSKTLSKNLIIKLKDFLIIQNSKSSMEQLELIKLFEKACSKPFNQHKYLKKINQLLVKISNGKELGNYEKLLLLSLYNCYKIPDEFRLQLAALFNTYGVVVTKSNNSGIPVLKINDTFVVNDKKPSQEELHGVLSALKNLNSAKGIIVNSVEQKL